MVSKARGWIVGLTLLVAGYIPSEHGLCPPDGGDLAVFNPDLLGRWVRRDPNSQEDQITRVERLKADSKTYKFVFEGDTHKDDSPLVGHLVPVGKRLYLDFFNLNPQKPDQKYHAFAQVELT